MNILITGIRGVPASHGGFETFAENLSIYLVEKGYNVTVYCQEDLQQGKGAYESTWNGVRRVHIPVSGDGPKATVLFDWHSIKHASKQDGIVLTLGYNTALFNILLRLKGKKNIINMDGIEWMRDKWSWYEKTWLYLNERIGCLVGHHLIADHPEIKNHLVTRVKESKVSMIPYGSRDVLCAKEEHLIPYGLSPKEYALVIARPEPENSILEIVKAFSCQKRHKKLVVLGKYDVSNLYHKRVLDSASSQVHFIGAVYEHDILDALRFHSILYIHGHTVGGTNPSLIEALGAGQPILAHNNKFNRWVAGDTMRYFDGELDCAQIMSDLFENEAQLSGMSKESRKRFETTFKWQMILEQYRNMIDSQA